MPKSSTPIPSATDNASAALKARMNRATTGRGSVTQSIPLVDAKRQDPKPNRHSEQYADEKLAAARRRTV